MSNLPRFACLLAVAALALLLGWAARAGAADDRVPLNEEYVLGKPVVVDNVTVWPVFAAKPNQPVGEYLTLAQAQEKKLAEVRETGAPAGDAAPANVQAANQAQNTNTRPQPQTTNAQPQQQPQTDDLSGKPRANENQVQNKQVQTEVIGAEQVVAGQQVSQADVSGQVNRLVIENKGTQAILVLAGTLVKGGRQDRQIAQDFIIPPGKTVPVDAFCVEHGRWTAQREGVNTAGQFQAQKVMATKEVRDSGQFKADQSAVWQEVANSNKAAGKDPGTGTMMATVEETDKDALARREKIRKAAQEAFAALAKGEQAPQGLAYAIDGKAKEVRCFADPKIFQLYEETLVNTLALEGDLAQRTALDKKEKVYDQVADAKKLVEMVQNVESEKEELKKTDAGNTNGYKAGKAGYNSNCYVPQADAKQSAPVTQRFSAKE
ncbi:MAG: hypothetical protein HY291_22105 [Planctomycetes bacterium]|nr:hypothetical protein [Planctomycetota bacterium]